MEIKENSQFYWDLAITLEDRKQEIESQLPSVSEKVFNEYCLVQELLGVLYNSVPNL